MGDFVGGMLKYLRAHPVPRVTIAGGVAKMTKLAQGMLDVHSKRGARRSDALGAVAASAGASAALADAYARREHRRRSVCDGRRRGHRNRQWVAETARKTAAEVIAGTGIELEDPGLRPRGTTAGPELAHRAIFLRRWLVSSPPRNGSWIILLRFAAANFRDDARQMQPPTSSAAPASSRNLFGAKRRTKSAV
jgi:hypothetical protein